MRPRSLILGGIVVAASALAIVLVPRGAANASPAFAAAGVAYPLKVSSNRRYLVDQRNVPFLIVGDSPQSMFVNLSERDAARFLANRKAAGFNAVWINLLCETYTAGRDDGTTYDGIAPFKTPGDVSTPNEAYFSRADRVIRLAARYGLGVFLDPIETGGWLKVLRKNGVAKDYAYGRYLGKRYGSFPNIVWFNGNDFQKWQVAANDAAALAVARGIRATDPNHIHTVQLNYPVSGSLDDPRWRPYIELNSAYTHFPTYAQVLKEYNRPNFLPVLMVEASYEFEHDYTGPQTLRRQEYWTMLSGATGQLYGNKYTWQFLKGWRDHLNTKGSAQIRYVTKLFAGRSWFKLVPDQDHTVVTEGYGQFHSDTDPNLDNYVTAARTPDGRLVIAYLPGIETLTVDMTKLAGPTRAQWYDPANGTYSAAASSPLENAGTMKFKPPGRNSDGEGDWVLVLTAS